MRKSRIWLALLLCCVLAFPAWLGGLAHAYAYESPFYLDSTDIVYVTHGYCYHDIPDCRNTLYSYAIDASEALRLGYRGCGNCNPFILDATPAATDFDKADIIVYMMVEDEHYHKNATCKKYDKPTKGRVFPRVQITLEEAKYLELGRCPGCKPPKY